MILWIILALLTVGVVLLLGKKVSLNQTYVNNNQSAEVHVYVDQLKQIETDLSQGTLSEAEATAARNEVARRLLKTTHEQSSDPVLNQVGTNQKISFSVFLLLSIPVLSLGLYAVLGSPEMPSMPHASRESPTASENQILFLVEKVEARLKEVPEDGTGWDVIAPIYLRLGNFDKAHEAYQKALQLLGENPKRLAGLIQSDIFLKDGKVSSESRSWCERLLQLEPSRVDARLWLTLAKEQSGQFEEALKDYRGLLQNQNLTEELSSLLRERIEALEKRKKGEVPSPKDVNPPTSETPSVPSETTQAQQEMIEKMVERLAQRLDTDSKDAEGWTKLLRSYMVLGRRDEAARALERARRALADDPQGLSLVNKEALNFGLDLSNSDQEGQKKQ